MRDRQRNAVRLQRLGVGRADAVREPSYGVDEIAVLAFDRITSCFTNRAPVPGIDYDVAVRQFNCQSVAKEMQARAMLPPSRQVAESVPTASVAKRSETAVAVATSKPG